MEGTPVYFIGGTFGGTGSGSSVGIILLTALITAGGAFLVGWGLEQRKRALDRRALAASLLAEVETVQKLFLHLGIEEKYRNLQNEMKAKIRAGTDSDDGFLGIPNEVLTFPITIYEKCADRIGILGPDTAREVVYFYNFLSGFRVVSKLATGDGDIPLPRRAQLMGQVVDMIADERPRLEDVQAKLRRVVEATPPLLP